MSILHAFDAALAAALPPGSLYAVGGRVRDELRVAAGETAEIKDGDYVVVGMPLEDVIAVLRTVGTVDSVGASFSILKVTRDGITVDVGLPRKEVSTGAGHRDFTVESGAQVTLLEDLARRDFRMNMIARAIPSGEIVDPFEGRADIRARRIDIVHERTFHEDPLRMLRACQFAARFGYAISDRAMRAMRAAAELVTTVSPQRIHEEFAKLLTRARRPSLGFVAMREAGVLAHVWPELLEGCGVEQNEWHAYDVWEHNLATLDAAADGDLVRGLAALLHDVGKPRTKDGPHFYRHEFVGEAMAAEMLARIATPVDVARRVGELVRHHMYRADPEMSDAAIRRFIRRVGVATLDDLYALRAADVVGSGLPKRGDENERFQARVAAELAREPVLAVTDLRISGGEVIAALRHAGATISPKGDRRVGLCLRYLLECVTDEPTMNEAKRLHALLDRFIVEDALATTQPPRGTEGA